jgi:hypothetical protein
MGLISRAMIFAILGTMFLGIAVVNAQVGIDLSHFKSGASIKIGASVDLGTLYQRADMAYNVVEHNQSHVIWEFTGTTGDYAFVYADGRIVVASSADFDLAAKDMLTKELNDVMDFINLLNAGITDEIRKNALASGIYYADESDIYHKIEFDYNKNLNDFTLIVPDCTVKKARLTFTGCDPAQCDQDKTPAQAYYINNNEVASCRPPSGHQWCNDCCNMEETDITNNILTPGKHGIFSQYVEAAHTMILEVLTSPSPPRKFVLYGPNFIPWINETGKSMTLDDMNSLITGTTNSTT